MKRLLLCSVVFTLLCFACPHHLQAQNATPHWAKKIYGSGPVAGNFTDIATDKHGNVYAIIKDRGYTDVDGHITTDSSDPFVLASWDCDGNFRWMKTFSSQGNNYSAHLEVDTLEGVYLSGHIFFHPTSSNTAIWDTDTSVTVPPSTVLFYLMKYNSLGQMQWFKTPVNSLSSNSFCDFAVSPSGAVYSLALMQAGSYSGGFTINSPKYYALQYNAAGNFQAAIPLDISIPSQTASTLGIRLKHDAVKNRFYTSIAYSKQNGNVTIGATPLTQPLSNFLSKAVLAAFNLHGNNLWVQQATPDTFSALTSLATGSDGTIFLGYESFPGTVFCGDTAINVLGGERLPQLMALDTTGNLLWVNRAVNKSFGRITSISVANNTLIGTGTFGDTLHWGNNTLAVREAYLVRANAATGAIVGLDNIATSLQCRPSVSSMDKNGNIYIGGGFRGTFSFGNDNFSSTPANGKSNQFLAKYRNIPQCNCDLLQPSFSHTNTAIGTYQFSYTGQMPYAAISWDFGDGTPVVTNTSSPSHIYSQPGTYPVCVTVTNGCGSNTTCQYLVLTTTGIAEMSANEDVQFYPNPANSALIVKGLERETTVEIFDVLGRMLTNKIVQTGAEKINVQDLSPGTYILRYTSKNSSGSKTFVKE